MTQKEVPPDRRTFVQSLNAAVEGFVHVIRHERNMRIHFLMAFLVLLAAILLGVSRFEWIILCFVVSFVLVVEMANTVIEETMDFIQVTYHPAIQLIKDVSAGAVLVATLNAVIVGFLIFAKYLVWPLEITVFRIRHSPAEITLVSLLTVIFIVIAGKAFSRRGTPLIGGILSGHAAVAFALWTAVVFVQDNVYVIFATLALALLVIQTRMRAKIHTFWELLAGAVLGILVTALFFKVFG
ncbi:MAG: diacylglycerol kinase [Candidatus Omnitrophota bacterium]